MTGTLLSIAVAQVLTILVGLLRAKALAVVLGPAQFGVVSTIDQVVLTLATLGALSLPFTALKFLASAHSEGEDKFRHATAMFIKVLCALGVVTTVVGLALIQRDPDVFGAELAAYQIPLQLALVGVPVTMLTMLLVNILAAAQLPARASLLTLVVAGVLAAAATAGAAVADVGGLYLATAAAGFLVVGFSVVWLGRRFGLAFREHAQSITVELRRHPDLVSHSMFIYLAIGTYAVVILFLRTTVLAQLGATAAGLLQAALSVALTLGAILGAANNMVLTPYVNRQIPVARKVEVADDFLRRTMLLLLLAALPVVLFPQLVMQILFTADFAPAGEVLYLFVLWQCVYQSGNVYHQLLIGLDDVRFASLSTSASFGLVAMVLPVLVMQFELAGVAMALLIGMVIRSGAAVWRLRHRFAVSVPPRALAQVVGVMVPVVLSGVGLAALPEQSLWGIVGRAAAGCAALLPAWWLLSPVERAAIRQGRLPPGFHAPGSRAATTGQED